jgi:hypothetical protein
MKLEVLIETSIPGTVNSKIKSNTEKSLSVKETFASTPPLLLSIKEIT